MYRFCSRWQGRSGPNLSRRVAIVIRSTDSIGDLADANGINISSQPTTFGAIAFFGRRWSSTGRSRYNRKRFELDALPFTISPEEALESFRSWAEGDQGLRYLLSYDSIRIGAAFVPVWSFDLNIRFKQGKDGSSSWKPPLFSVYGSQDIHVPGLSAYSGYSYRRSLLNPVHSTTLVFMNGLTQPFGGWMLRDLSLQSTGQPIQVIPDAWNATQAQALSVVKEDLQGVVDSSWSSNSEPPKVQTEVVSSRRVYMPTYGKGISFARN